MHVGVLDGRTESCGFEFYLQQSLCKNDENLCHDVSEIVNQELNFK